MFKEGDIVRVINIGRPHEGTILKLHPFLTGVYLIEHSKGEDWVSASHLNLKKRTSPSHLLTKIFK